MESGEIELPSKTESLAVQLATREVRFTNFKAALTELLRCVRNCPAGSMGFVGSTGFVKAMQTLCVINVILHKSIILT